MNWRKSIISLLVIVVLFVLAYLLYGKLAGMAESPEEKQKEAIKLFVKTEKVSYKTNKAKITETGRLSSQQTVDLSAEVQGQILPGEVILKEGTKFEQGALLIRIFDEEAKNNLKAGKSRFMNGIASILPDIRIDFPESFQKYQDFFNSIKIDKPLPELPKLDSDKEKVFLASRNILNDYFSIKSSEVRLSKYRLYAPFNGTFTAVYLEPGSVANPGSRIASMIRTDKLELEVPVRIEDAYWIKVGDKVQVSTKDRLLHWTGTVVRKSEFMDPSSQAITIYVALASEKDKPLYQGQYLMAEFASKTINSSMEIPRNAVFNKDRVFTVENGKLKENQVEILKTSETTVIFSGLPEGVNLVVEPLVNAKEGFNAEILN
ncbi:MAG: HlyD family efflux transporter periplasmic adaptor subunit [Bacteroidetes bacterium]|nr:HlyD family efflux transporter periplasmic adaptor subunit [Bacteroidota bacterium]MBL7105699.1 HlyD family efflux transporter periplasmic adaptor subunit [Bacteroidales bacterium]